MIEKNKIIDVLKQCFDPEIPIDLWSLGLIYDISITESTKNKSNVTITMTLTTPGCSMGSYMAEDIKMKLNGLDEINECIVNITFDTPWKPEMMNDEARQKLGFPIEKSEKQNQDTIQNKKERNWE